MNRVDLSPYVARHAMGAEAVGHLCRARYPEYLERILTARVYEAAVETPLEMAPGISRRIGHRVWLKREDLQPVFSFKIRGAYNKIASLSVDERARGVVAASAGNHAQGVAWATRAFECRAVVVMPHATPSIKVEAVRRLGGEVLLHGQDFRAAYDHAVDIARKQDLVFVHPYDDPAVIAGQGTVAVEILRQSQAQIDAIFVPVGGGGLLSGIALYAKRLYPHIRIVGVEPADAASMHRSLITGRRVSLSDVGRFADGVAVTQVGAETFRICSDLVDEVVLVSNDAICAAIQDVFEDTRSILEPAGALGVAGLKAWSARAGVEDQQLVAITSGANMNFDRLRYVVERAELGEHREALLCVTIPERPGSFLRLQRVLGTRDVTEFNYRRHNPQHAHVFVGVAVSGAAATSRLVDEVRAADFECVDVSGDDVVQSHVKHMVGGRSASARHERIFHVRFPERPGALRRFLEQLPISFNISLFHYRNHGGDVADVLVGMEAPPSHCETLDTFLCNLDYPFREQTQHAACRMFL